MPSSRTRIAIFASVAAFIGLAGTIIYLAATKIIDPVLAKLMLVALLGLYVGFGVLIAAYRLLRKLE